MRIVRGLAWNNMLGRGGAIRYCHAIAVGLRSLVGMLVWRSVWVLSLAWPVACGRADRVHSLAGAVDGVGSGVVIVVGLGRIGVGMRMSGGMKGHAFGLADTCPCDCSLESPKCPGIEVIGATVPDAPSL